jgi:hypothetical protein
MAVQLQWPVVVTAIRNLASQLIIDNQQVLKSPAHRGEPVLKVGVVRISNGSGAQLHPLFLNVSKRIRIRD